MTIDAIDAIDAILAGADEADDALRGVVRELASRPGVAWAGIAFVEDGELVLGPSAGTPSEAHRRLATVCYKGEAVGELRVDGQLDRATVAAVAERLGEHVLLGWDTRGEAWEP
jgi:hypothetical protein